MDKSALVEYGLELSVRLEQLADRCNMRSDEYELLTYESFRVREQALDLQADRGALERFKDASPLPAMSLIPPEIIGEVRNFHERYRLAKGSGTSPG